jgi:hypothetical protein
MNCSSQHIATGSKNDIYTSATHIGGKAVTNTCKVGGIREVTGAITILRRATNEEMRRQPQIIISWEGDILGSET